MKHKDLKIDFRYLTGNIACLSVDSISGESVHNDINNEEAIIIFNSLVGEKENCQTVKTLLKENQSLKKQLENANEQVIYLRKSIERKEETIIDLQNERVPYTNEYVAKLENQQKEFIEYLEDGVQECNNYSKYIEKKVKELKQRSYGKTYIANEIMKNETAKKCLKEILSKYKELIGGNNGI